MGGSTAGGGGGLAGAVRALEDAASIRGGGCAAPPESMDAAGIAGAYCAAVALRAHMGAAERAAEGAGAARGGGAAGRAAEAMAAFDSSFHPRAMGRLAGLADEIAGRLESGAGGEDPAEYDRLREAMSAAEFARQYDAGLRGE